MLPTSISPAQGAEPPPEAEALLTPVIQLLASLLAAGAGEHDTVDAIARSMCNDDAESDAAMSPALQLDTADAAMGDAPAPAVSTPPSTGASQQAGLASEMPSSTAPTAPPASGGCSLYFRA